jgi:hypothetical protein
MPKGHHKHSGEEWVSLDVDGKIKPDIEADVKMIDKVIGSIEKKVYIEHFNDKTTPPLTYQGELLKKLFKIMKPGAVLYMDYYPIVEWMDGGVKAFYDWENSPYGVVDGIDTTRNYFWAAASFNHFKKAIKKGSTFDTFGGRKAVLDWYVADMKENKKFMAGMPAHLTTDAARNQYLLERAGATLDLRLQTSPSDRWKVERKVFYGAKNLEKVKGFMKELGFTKVMVMSGMTNPFNGRKGERMIVAVKPAEASATAGATVESKADGLPDKGDKADRKEIDGAPAGS